MAITVEYGKCDKCGDNNVKTAQLCRSCTSALPWARDAAKTPSAVNVGVHNTLGAVKESAIKVGSFPGFSAGFYVQVLGGLIFIAGGVIFVAHVLGAFHTMLPVGRFTIFIGSVIWGSGAAMDKHGADG